MPTDPSSRQPAPGDDAVSLAGVSFLLPGGKVDGEAVRKAWESDAEAPDADGAALRVVRIEIRSDIQKRLDKYLTDRVTFMSRSQLQTLIDEGGVLVNGRTPKASTNVRRGDVIEVEVPPPPAKDIVPEDIPIEVLFEDQHLIVLNKSPDIIVHPARTHLKGTLLSALAFHFKHRSNIGGTLSSVGKDLARPGVVHRLDRQTSGVIVFAKSEEAHWKLGLQFEHRKVDKRYLAVVEGRVEPIIETIDLPLGPHPSREKGYREKQVVRHDELGKPSVTVCRVRERFDPAGGVSKGRAGYSLVELELRTGRTHQIRVHLSHTGYPIVGDDMYSGSPFTHDGRTLIARQALHAARLGFRHPIDGRELLFTAPVPPDMRELIRVLRARPGFENCSPPGVSVDLAAAVPD